MGAPKRNRDLGRIDNATAKRLLKQHERIVWALAPLFPHIEREELLSAGRLAILEAHLTWEADKGCSRTTWTRNTIWWRLTDMSKREQPIDGDSLGTDPQVVNGANPEQQFWQTTAVRAIARLSPRHQVLVSAWMAGETFAEVAATIGISGPLAHRETHKALAQLRQILESSELW